MATTINTTSAISNATAQVQKPKSPANLMRAITSAPATQKLLVDTLKENAGSFTASVLDLYSSDTFLQKCDAGAVFAECMKAASLKLPINKQLGFAYVIPFRNSRKGGMYEPQFQLGYKGMLQLCMRTGAYKYINCGAVYEGELVKVDKLTGEVDLNGTKTGDNIVGYFAYMETINGFRKTLYWTKDEVIRHANRYSKSYQQGSAIWKDNFEEMAQKTVLRNLLSHYGVMSVEMVEAMSAENAEYADQRITGEDKPVTVDFEINEATGEVVDAE